MSQIPEISKNTPPFGPILLALSTAESFMSGFEDDELQEGMEEMLTEVRAAMEMTSKAFYSHVALTKALSDALAFIGYEAHVPEIKLAAYRALGIPDEPQDIA